MLVTRHFKGPTDFFLYPCSPKYLCFTKQRNECGFGTTSGWENL